MITLSQAYKLCDCDGAFLHPYGTHGINRAWLSDRKIRDYLDMKKIRVVKIGPRIDMNDGEFLGMCFEVVGITPEELFKVSMKN